MKGASPSKLVQLYKKMAKSKKDYSRLGHKALPSLKRSPRAKH